MPRKPHVLYVPEKFITAEVLDRFFSKTYKDQHGCLVWNAGVFSHSGYGCAKLPREVYRHFGLPYNGMNAHRVAMLLRGHVFEEPDIYALHACPRFNKLCLAEGHLYAGTAQDNMIDRCFEPGDASVKLTPDEVQAIRTRLWRARHAQGLRDGTLPQAVVAAIAADFGVAPQTVDTIRYGVNWAHLPERIQKDRSLGTFA